MAKLKLISESDKFKLIRLINYIFNSNRLYCDIGANDFHFNVDDPQYAFTIYIGLDNFCNSYYVDEKYSVDEKYLVLYKIRNDKACYVNFSLKSDDEILKALTDGWAYNNQLYKANKDDVEFIKNTIIYFDFFNLSKYQIVDYFKYIVDYLKKEKENE